MSLSADIDGNANHHAEVVAWFDELELGQSERGRIVVESQAPYFIESLDGIAARILNSSSSRLSGRRFRGITDDPTEMEMVEQAASKCLASHQRAYLSVTKGNGRVPLALQVSEKMGTPRLEVVLFPVSQHRCSLLLTGIIFVDSDQTAVRIQ